MFAAIPLLALPVLAYHLAVLTLPDGFGEVEAAQRLGERLFAVRMPSGVDWPVSLGDLLLAVALAVLFFELLKSAASRSGAVLNQALSMLLFVVCLVEFLLLPAFATSVFFLIGLMVLLDLLAGFIASLVAARGGADYGEPG